jgi:AcrR family transcriptional regulator
MDQAILNAVLEMVSEGATLSSLSLVSISQRAGVSRNSIYRRWKTKDRLFVDVVRSIGRAAPELTEQSARENLVMALDSFTHDIDTRVLRLEQAIIAEAVTFPDLYEYFRDVIVAPLRSVLKVAVRAGKESGEIRVDVDENELVAALVAINRARVSERDVWNIDAAVGSQRLVDLTFDGVSPR